MKIQIIMSMGVLEAGKQDEDTNNYVHGCARSWKQDEDTPGLKRRRADR